MYYFLLILATFFVGFQHISTKGYQKKNGNTLTASLVFSLLTGFFSAVFFFILNNCRYEFSNFSIICAAILGFSCVICMYFGIEVIARGKMATYTLFLMMGGMVLPFIYGAVYLQESVTVTKIIGLIVLSGALLIPIFTSNKEKDGGIKGNKIVYFIFCFLLFLLNGFISIIIKHHQANTAEAISTNGFGILYFAFVSFTALLFLIGKYCFSKVIKIKRSKEENSNIIEANHINEETIGEKFNKRAAIFCIMYAIFSGLSSFLQLECAREISAVILFPIFTGSTMIFTALFSLIIYKEKLNIWQIISLILSIIAIVLFAF